jgi:DNA-binding CsgD family transcriptional regulator
MSWKKVMEEDIGAKLILVARVILGASTRFDLAEVISNDLQALIRYDCASVGLCHIRNNTLYPWEVAALNFPEGFLGKLLFSDNSAGSSQIYAHFLQGRPMLIDTDANPLPELDDEDGTRHVGHYGISGVALHGVVDLSGQLASYFCLGRTLGQFPNSHYMIVRLIAPYMHSAILQVARDIRAVSPPFRMPIIQPTDRELEILSLIYKGKTNKEIGRALGISDMTVKNHAKNIYFKLTVRNRCEAAAKAVRLGLISLQN